MRRLLAGSGASGALATLLAKGWTGIALAMAVIIVVVLALCWIINNPDRPERLALLLAAWRGTRSTREMTRSEPAAGRTMVAARPARRRPAGRGAGRAGVGGKRPRHLAGGQRQVGGRSPTISSANAAGQPE